MLVLLFAWSLAALTPTQRSQRARIAALTRWSREDPAATAARGQAVRAAGPARNSYLPLKKSAW